MNDRMSDLDALVDVAANGVIETREYVAGVAFGVPDDARGVYVKAIARAALLAVGLPALLERVEAAEEQAERLGDLLADFYVLPSDEPIRRRLIEADVAIAERDALAAKVADAGERIAQAIEDYINPQDCGDDPTCEQCTLVRQLATVARTALDASETP